jgi:hypothetical protein
MRFKAKIETRKNETLEDAVKRTVNADYVGVAVTGLTMRRADGTFGVLFPKSCWPVAMGGQAMALHNPITLTFDTEEGWD